MKAEITGVENRRSYHGGIFYHIFFKGEDGKSYLTNAYPKYKDKPIRNFSKWEKVIKNFRDGNTVIMDSLRILDGNTIDADSGTINEGEGRNV